MNDSAKAKQTPYQKYLHEQRIKRYNAIVATIPGDLSPQQRIAYGRYAYLCAQNLGRRKLAMIPWPWNAQPQGERVKRGNPRPNNP